MSEIRFGDSISERKHGYQSLRSEIMVAGQGFDQKILESEYKLKAQAQQCKQVERAGEIPDRMKSLEASADFLENRFESLSKKLTSVVPANLSEGCRDNQNSTDPITKTLIGSSLLNVEKRIVRIAHLAELLLNNIEL